MADRHGKRIGGILRRSLFQPQQRPNHQLHLTLLRAAVPNHTHLHFHRRVLTQLDTGFRRGQQGYTTNMRQLERAFGVHRVENFFHGHRFRPVIVNQRSQRRSDHSQTQMKAFRSTRPDNAGSNHAVSDTIRFNDAEASAFGSAIDSEDTHHQPNAHKLIAFNLRISAFIGG